MIRLNKLDTFNDEKMQILQSNGKVKCQDI